MNCLFSDKNCQLFLYCKESQSHVYICTNILRERCDYRISDVSICLYVCFLFNVFCERFSLPTTSVYKSVFCSMFSVKGSPCLLQVHPRAGQRGTEARKTI